MSYGSLQLSVLKPDSIVFTFGNDYRIIQAKVVGLLYSDNLAVEGGVIFYDLLPLTPDNIQTIQMDKTPDIIKRPEYVVALTIEEMIAKINQMAGPAI